MPGKSFESPEQTDIVLTSDNHQFVEYLWESKDELCRMKKSNAFITSDTRTNGGGGNFILSTADSDYNRYAYRTDVQPSESERDTRQAIYTSKFARRAYSINTRFHRNILYVYVSFLNLHLFADKIWVQIYNLSRTLCNTTGLIWKKIYFNTRRE